MAAMPINRFLKALCLFSCFLLSSLAAADMDYPPRIKTTLEQRCMVCHGCYDAPCQLKLDAWQGLQRGASAISQGRLPM